MNSCYCSLSAKATLCTIPGKNLGRSFWGCPQRVCSYLEWMNPEEEGLLEQETPLCSPRTYPIIAHFQSDEFFSRFHAMHVDREGNVFLIDSGIFKRLSTDGYSIIFPHSHYDPHSHTYDWNLFETLGGETFAVLDIQWGISAYSTGLTLESADYDSGGKHITLGSGLEKVEVRTCKGSPYFGELTDVKFAIDCFAGCAPRQRLEYRERCYVSVPWPMTVLDDIVYHLESRAGRSLIFRDFVPFIDLGPASKGPTCISSYKDNLYLMYAQRIDRVWLKPTWTVRSHRWFDDKTKNVVKAMMLLRRRIDSFMYSLPHDMLYELFNWMVS